MLSSTVSCSYNVLDLTRESAHDRRNDSRPVFRRNVINFVSLDLSSDYCNKYDRIEFIFHPYTGIAGNWVMSNPIEFVYFFLFFFFYRIINRIEKYSNRDVQLLFSFLWRAIFTSFPIRREFHKEKESFEKNKKLTTSSLSWNIKFVC